MIKMIKNKKINLIALLAASSMLFTPAFADNNELKQKLEEFQNEDLIQAQEKHLTAKGMYSTVKTQEKAVKNLRKASKMHLKAASLREKAEKLQIKADGLIQNAKQTAKNNGLYFDGEGPLQMEESLTGIEQTADASTPENVVPGQPINIYLPTQQTVTKNPSAPIPN